VKERWKGDAQVCRCAFWKIEGNFCFWDAERDCGVTCPRCRWKNFIFVVTILILCGVAFIICHDVIQIRDDVHRIVLFVGGTGEPVIRDESLWKYEERFLLLT
jgi:hypothetical protein